VAALIRRSAEALLVQFKSGVFCAPFVLRLRVGESTERKLGKFYRQNVMPGNAMFFVSNLLSSSQAGRRGFDPRLPLHSFSITSSLHGNVRVDFGPL
jgi:hypothetical protein